MPENTNQNNSQIAENNNNEILNISLDAQIEAILFYKAEPIKISELAKILNKTKEEVSESLTVLENNLKNRGVALTSKEDQVMLVTANSVSSLIQNLKKEELIKDLSKAALETLSIIIYRGPLKRSEIDYIRGVNSQFILRLLLIRGLIEKITDPKDERAFLYKISFDLLNILGINKISDFPEFESVNKDIDGFIESQKENDL